MKSLSLATTASALTVISFLRDANAFGIAVPRTPTTSQSASSFSSFALAATSVADTDTAANPRLDGLALALDDGTRKSHSVAENTAFVQGFFKGISSTDSYRNLLTSLYYVYDAMETKIMDETVETNPDSEDAKWIAALDEGPLRRLNGLEKDMEYFYGASWKTDMIPPTKATQAYVNRINELASSVEKDGDDSDSELYLFVAHQYTRYLGDLFGGQMMGSMASRSMDLPKDGSGVAFYTFEDVKSTKDFITKWYGTLNNLGVSAEKQQAIVDEANLCFQLNIAVFEELEGSPWAALWTMAVSAWTNVKESKNGPVQA